MNLNSHIFVLVLYAFTFFFSGRPQLAHIWVHSSTHTQEHKKAQELLAEIITKLIFQWPFLCSRHMLYPDK